MPTENPHAGPVPPSAWDLDAQDRERGRVRMFNATLPGGVETWTMDLTQYEVVATFIVDMIDEEADPDGTIRLQAIVDAANDRLADHPAFPNGRLTNFVRYTKVDLEARRIVERIPGSSPQRVRRWSAD